MRRDPLPVDGCAIYTIQVFEVNLASFDDQPGMPPAHTGLVTTIRVQVDIRKDAADGVFTTECDICFPCRDGERYLRLLDDEATWNRDRSGLRRNRRLDTGCLGSRRNSRLHTSRLLGRLGRWGRAPGLDQLRAAILAKG